MGTRRRSSGGGRWTLAIAGAAVCVAILAAAAPAAAKPKCAGKKATIVGSQGRDVLRGNAGPDVIVARGGRDRVLGKGGRDLICGGSGADTLSGGTGRDVVEGGSGDDFFRAGAGSDKIFGASGNDVMVGGPGGEHAVGGPGNDRMYGGQQDDDLRGSSGDDLLIGDQGNDDLRGEDGNDWLRGDTQPDRIEGGPGDDWVSYATLTMSSKAALIAGVGPRGGHAGQAFGHDEFAGGLENLVGSPYLDVVGGTGLPGTLRGLGWVIEPDRPDWVDQCSGFATLECGQNGTGGAVPAVLFDTTPQDPGIHVIGGPASDAFEISRTQGGVRVSSKFPLAPAPGCNGGGTTVVTCSVPPLGYVVAYGGDGNDSITVNADFGPATTVRVDGGGGSDVISGGPGDEILEAGAFEATYPNVRIPDTVLGGGGDDSLLAAINGPDTLRGGPGSDQLIALNACQGHILDGGPGGSDIAGFARNPGQAQGVKAKIGGRTVSLDKHQACVETGWVSASTEILEGTDNHDVLMGSPGNDALIIGHPGNDVILGFGGADRLRGDAGSDTLVGGHGPDTLEAADGERDRRLDCGPGGGRAHRDSRDPKPRRCG
jgi:Ca2+-binding RTX toxin-like protein